MSEQSPRGQTAKPRRRNLLEQMVSWQRRALGSLCGRVDLLQADIDRQAGAQTDLESRLLDLERVVFGGCCARCGSAVEGSAAFAEAQWRADVGALGGSLLQARCESRAFSFDPRARGACGALSAILSASGVDRGFWGLNRIKSESDGTRTGHRWGDGGQASGGS